ncbi:MAG: hypothetical protein ABEL04_03860 [Salinibacter sp.]|uniref:hypothetical protein n=1 Tax=Salinibacter sp. TaxID=2065818 RepID=UPI0035D42A0D
MVANEHYKRLKHLYANAPAESATGHVDISYGYAEISGIVEPSSPDSLLNRMPHQRLLSDASSLAASSVEKEGMLELERINVGVSRTDYRGPVKITAEVAVAEPPRYHVRAVMVNEDEEVLAEALSLFEPSGEELPPDPAPEAVDEDESAPSPAPFMPIHVTQYGVLCLN